MKIDKKIVLFFFLIIILIETIAYANYSSYYSDRLNITVNNINDDIRKIELLAVKDCNPADVFEYEIVKKYGTYYNRNDYSGEIPIWNEEDLNDFKNDINKTVFSREEEIRLYKVTEVDSSKYILIKFGEKEPGYIMNDIGYITYLDLNKNYFALDEIITVNNIESFKIKNGAFDLSIKDLKLYGRREHDYVSDDYVPNFYLRFYKENGDFKDIAIGQNSYTKTDYDSVALISKCFDYQTGKQTLIKKNTTIFSMLNELVITIGIAIFLTVLFEMFVAGAMNLAKYDITIIKVNIFTQMLFHLVFLIPQTLFNKSLVTIIGEILMTVSGNALSGTAIMIIAIGIIELVIVILEYLLYKKFIKSETKGKLLKYSILANLTSFGASLAFLIVATMIFVATNVIA